MEKLAVGRLHIMVQLQRLQMEQVLILHLNQSMQVM